MIDTADTLRQRGYQARREHRLRDAHRDYSAAVAAYGQAGDRHNLVQALKRLGGIERDMGHDDAALALYKEAVALCREVGDPDLLAHTIRHIGDIYQDLGRADLAEPCFVEALAIYRNNPDTGTLDLGNAIRPYAILLEGKGEREEAKRLWEEVRNLYAAVGVQAGIDECDAHLAQLTMSAAE